MVGDLATLKQMTSLSALDIQGACFTVAEVSNGQVTYPTWSKAGAVAKGLGVGRRCRGNCSCAFLQLQDSVLVWG